MSENIFSQTTTQQNENEPSKESPDLTKIFIGNINRNATEEEFDQYLKENGWEVTELNFVKDPATGGVRGFAFVNVSSESHADSLLMKAPYTFQGRELDVKRATPKDVDDPLIHTKTSRVFIGGLPPTATDEDLKKFFTPVPESPLGGVTDVIIKKDRATGKSRGFCFMSFKTFHLVDKIILINRKPIFQNKRIEIRKADPNFPINGAPPTADGTYVATPGRVRGGVGGPMTNRGYQQTPYKSSLGPYGGHRQIVNARPEPRLANPRQNPGYTNRAPPAAFATGGYDSSQAVPMQGYGYGSAPMYPPSYMPSSQAYNPAAYANQGVPMGSNPASAPPKAYK